MIWKTCFQAFAKTVRIMSWPCATYIHNKINARRTYLAGHFLFVDLFVLFASAVRRGRCIALLKFNEYKNKKLATSFSDEKVHGD